MKYVKVVFSQYQARKEGLKIDKDDSLAYKQDMPYSLLIHGSQKAGTPASKAWQRVKATVGGYSK